MFPATPTYSSGNFPVAVSMPTGSFPSAYDPDALAFFTTASVTDSTGKMQLSQYAAGMKGAGLWFNSVAWLLRSTQSAGTGSIAYSFGGLIVSNGTLVNGPTWETSGIRFFKALSQQISVTLPALTRGCQLCDFTASGTAGTTEGIYDRGNGHHYVRSDGVDYMFGIFNGGATTISAGVASTSTARNKIGANYGPPGMSTAANGSGIATNSYTSVGSSVPTTVKIGNAQIYWNGTITAFVHLNRRLSLAESNVVFSLIP